MEIKKNAGGVVGIGVTTSEWNKERKCGRLKLRGKRSKKKRERRTKAMSEKK